MEKLIAEIEQDTLHTAFLTGVKHIDDRVLAAMREIDRSVFVRPIDQQQAFEDHPLDIGFGQTISQPFIVALMIHLIEPKENDKVLEVGAGSGYLVAVLSKLCKQIFGIEVIEELKKRAEENLRNHKIHNVEIIFSDGTAGLKSHAPFDKIIVSAAATRLPEPLLEQLVLGGIMVIPKNISPFQQMLIRINKISKTEFKMTDILPVRFVPLVNS